MTGRRVEGRKTENTRAEDHAFHLAMVKFMTERGFLLMASHHTIQARDLEP
jgi:hypothetical protein